jgi:hypothetical protein
MTSYPSTLTGLTSVLFIIHWVCEQTGIGDGAVTMYCNNESALNETFTLNCPMNNPFILLAADIDLNNMPHDLQWQLLITVTFSPQWIQQHKSLPSSSQNPAMLQFL